VLRIETPPPKRFREKQMNVFVNEQPDRRHQRR
jgi:hypothetical protein